jgi:hypothetical protein
MDLEIRRAIDAIRADLRGLEARLRSDLHSEISSLESRLRPDIRLIAEAVADLDAKAEVLSLQAPVEK